MHGYTRSAASVDCSLGEYTIKSEQPPCPANSAWAQLADLHASVTQAGPADLTVPAALHQRRARPASDFHSEAPYTGK